MTEPLRTGDSPSWPIVLTLYRPKTE